jgi:hypothetical protein
MYFSASFSLFQWRVGKRFLKNCPEEKIKKCKKLFSNCTIQLKNCHWVHFWPRSWAVLVTAFFFFSSHLVFSQWDFPLLFDFLSDIWISLWCNNHDAIIFYIRYNCVYFCWFLSIPVCFLSIPVCFFLILSVLSVSVCSCLLQDIFVFKIPIWCTNLWLLQNFLHEIWISFWCNNYDAIIQSDIMVSIPICSCWFLSIPVCSFLFLSVPLCFFMLEFHI